MKKLLFLGACLVVVSSQAVMAQTNATEVVVVKVTETFGHLELDIAWANTKLEHREFTLKQLKEKGEGNYVSCQAEYTRSLFVELLQQGYTLTTTYTANAGAGSGPSTLVFTKQH